MLPLFSSSKWFGSDILFFTNKYRMFNENSNDFKTKTMSTNFALVPLLLTLDRYSPSWFPLSLNLRVSIKPQNKYWYNEMTINFFRKVYFKVLSDCNGTWTHYHLVRKRTLNHLVKLAKCLSCVVSTYLYGAFDKNIQVYSTMKILTWIC